MINGRPSFRHIGLWSLDGLPGKRERLRQCCGDSRRRKSRLPPCCDRTSAGGARRSALYFAANRAFYFTCAGKTSSWFPFGNQLLAMVFVSLAPGAAGLIPDQAYPRNLSLVLSQARKDGVSIFRMMGHPVSDSPQLRKHQLKITPVFQGDRAFNRPDPSVFDVTALDVRQ